jgi:outer membrane biosynthesis protein TonB
MSRTLSYTRLAAHSGVQSVWFAALFATACGGSAPQSLQPQPEPETHGEASATQTATPAARGAASPTEASSADATAAQADPSGPKRPGATVPETRTTQVMQSIVVQNRQQIRACYEAALNQQPELQGKLTVHFTIDSAGTVTAADVNQARTTLHDPKIQACALNAIRAINFPRSSRGFESTVNYPFDFKPN